MTVAGRVREVFALLSAILLAGSAYAAHCSFSATTTAQTLSYAFSPVASQGRLALHVTLKFQGGRSGVTELELPSRWAGQTELYRGITNLRAVSRGASISDTEHPATKNVRFPPDSTVAIEYDVEQDWNGPLQYPKQYRGVLAPAYFELRAGNVLAFPELEKAVSVRFDWTKLPKDWALATSFATGARCQSYYGPSPALRDALFVAGDFRIHHFRVGGQPAVLAIRGQWKFTDDDAVGSVQKVISTIRAFWHEDNIPYYLVVLTPFDTDKGSSNGTALTNGFCLYLSKQEAITDHLTIFAHEALHEWNPRRMGEPRGVTWFHEGFTTYYADLLLYRAGLMSLSTYVERLNAELRRYPGSTDPYVRGHILAVWLDGEIRRASHNRSSLDNVLFDLVRPAGGVPLTQDRILGAAGRHLPEDKRVLLRRLVEQALDVPLAADTPGPCVDMVLQEIWTFDVGFDLRASQAARRVIGLKPDGPADRAGLREGQELMALSVYNDKPSELVRLTVQTESGTRIVEYYPRGTRVTVPQYRLKQNTPNSAAQACGLAELHPDSLAR